MSRLALVRPPSPRLAEGLVTHIERSPVDVALAEQQWHDYVAALQANGWDTVHVAPAPDCPDSAFVEDTMVVFRDVAVLARPGADERKPEVTAAADAVAALGYRTVAIEAPGTLDGGDVLKVDDVIYVGNGGRTNVEGIAQLAAAFEPLGATVVTVPLSKVLHLKSAVTALPDGTIIGWLDAVDDVDVFPNFLAMPEESGSHVVILDDRTLLISADCPRSAELLESRGYATVRVDISEYIKLEGCVTCLSVRLREAPSRRT
ncbi:MAG: dimethylargininase [Ilumatobacteraceae bacterium]